MQSKYLSCFKLNLSLKILSFQARALPSISEEQKGHQTLSPEVTLKYSCFKNLGNLYMKSKKFDEASKYYLKVRILNVAMT